jgi:hypothetical protein
MLPAQPLVNNPLLGGPSCYCLRVMRRTPPEEVFEKPRSFSRMSRTMIFVQLFCRCLGKASREPAVHAKQFLMDARASEIPGYGLSNCACLSLGSPCLTTSSF